MATDDDSAETWKFKCGQYDWGEWWEGTKQQLQAVGIGLGVSFPGEPGAPKKLVHTIDARGVKVDIQSRAYNTPHGVFWATSPYVDRADRFSEGDDPPIEYAPGVVLVRHWHGIDEFRGAVTELAACGLIEEHQLPGQVGRGKTRCTYLPDGTAKPHGQSSKVSGTKTVIRRGASRFIIEVQVSDEEEKQRRSRRELREVTMSIEDAEGRRKREALTGPAPGKEERAQEVHKDPGINEETNLVVQCSAVFSVGDQVLVRGVVAEITEGYRLRSVTCENGEYLSPTGSGKKITYRPGYVYRDTTGDVFFCCAHELQKRYDKNRVSYLRLVRQPQSMSQARSV